MQLKEHTLFANRFDLLHSIGRGGFSEVWLAKDSFTKLDIAVKIYAPGQGMDSDGLADFSAELARVFALNHTNLLKPTHVDSWEGMPYLIMPYCSKGSLSKKVGKMTEAEIWELIHDVASGLAYLHKRDIIHQDIKPANILIDEGGNYVITDFGISTKARTTLRKSTINAGNLSGGTIEYMGPERFGENPKPVKASDIWSLGAMIFELMTGDVPFIEHGGLIQRSGAVIPYIEGNYSDELKSLVFSMLAMEPWDRPTAEQLSHIEIGTPIRKEPASRPTMPASQPTVPVSQPTMPVTQPVAVDVPKKKRFPIIVTQLFVLVILFLSVLLISFILMIL